MLRRSFSLFFLVISFTSFAQQTQSPAEFLGYEIGERFTRHHLVVDYFKHVAEHNNNVKLIHYGETYEHRPLLVAVVSSTENINRLDQIKLNNLRRTGLAEGNAGEDNTTIVWLSYNIHGNEASSTEASMLTIYDLIDPQNKEAREWLENAIVIIDPCVNPDGRDRYVNFFSQFSDRNFNPAGDAMEHREPWPGGRPNHYLFDLNRDWAWQTQKESRERSKLYHEWMPHVHVDFHEQGYNNPYYFAPAAEPFHEVITPWQREFQTTIGKNNAKYFDREGWLYFTKQRFDLLYPSYGDTYPTYNGAIGMTYEQAGHGFAGLGVVTEFGDTLTLAERALHHYTTGMSTIEITSQNASRVVNEFSKYFKNSLIRPSSEFKSYIISGDNEQDKINKLLSFLDRQKISYGLAPAGGRGITVFDYQDQGNKTVAFKQGDIVISTFQPLGNLVSVLFEPKTSLSDTLTYDITAWSLPYAYGLKAYATTVRIIPTGSYKASAVQQQQIVQKPYGYIAKYSSFEDARFLSYLLKNKINVRVAHYPFTMDGEDFERGSLIITRRTNEAMGAEFDRLVIDGAKKLGRRLYFAKSGMAERGADLGSSDVSRIKAPKVAVLAGEQTSSLSFGEIWYFFEQELQYPVTNIRTDYFSNINLENYDVFIVPSGSYKIFDEEMLKMLSGWVRAGGKLIVMGNALKNFADSEGFSLKTYDDEAEKKKFEEILRGIETAERIEAHEEIERSSLNKSIFGAIYKIKLDNTHPLAYGYDNHYFTLKTSNARFAYLPKSGNVGILQDKSKPVSGYAGRYANQHLQNSLVFGVESLGSGSVVYLVDNPLFRAFWENGKLLFSNAVFITGQ